MINVKFTQQNVLYHVFNVSFLSAVVNNNTSNTVFVLKQPQIIYSLHGLVKKQGESFSDSSIHFSMLDCSNTSIAVSSQEDVNNMIASKPLLHDKSKNKRRKRYNSKAYLLRDLPSTKDNDSANKALVKSLTRNTDVSGVLDSKAEFHHKIPQNLVIRNPLTVNELSELIAVPTSEIIKFLFLKGISVTVNQTIGIDIATSIAADYGFVVVNNCHEMNAFTNNLSNTDLINNQPRPPMIAIVGNASHGKTSLLQAIQNGQKLNKKICNVTQEIKVHETSVNFNNKSKKVIFLDTPGHEAFINMKYLGIKITDLVVLVVAANEGLTPQAVEVIKYIKINQSMVLIVISKMDIAGINIDKVKHDIINHEAFPTEWMNYVPIIPVSAITGENIDTLLSNIVTLLEKQDLKANPSQRATGMILNACLDKSRGPIAHVIVQNGTLNVGDFIVAGTVTGKVRVISSNRDLKLQSAGPASFVEVWGLSKIPVIGYRFVVTSNDKEAKKIAKQALKADNVLPCQRQLNVGVTTNLSGDLQQVDRILQVRLIIKADTQGSVDAIILSFSNILQLKEHLRIMSISIGMITETDTRLAVLTKSVIIGFNVGITAGAQRIAKDNGIDMRRYTIMDNLLQDLRNCIKRSVEVEQIKGCIGTAEVRSIFSLSTGLVAGCIVNSGKIVFGSSVKVFRNESLVYEGSIQSLKHMKNDILEAKEGEEFGVSVAGFDDWEINDRIECYNV